MAVDPEFESFVRELFEPMDHVTFRRMFGGLGIFRYSLMFALCSSQGVVAMKADSETQAQFEEEGCEEWSPHLEMNTKPVSMGYWQIPERLFDDPEEFREWAETAFDAAKRLDARKPPSQRKLKL